MGYKNELGVELCEAMNIPSKGATGLTLSLHVGNIAKVTVERILLDDQADCIRKVIEKYQFTPTKKEETQNGRNETDSDS